MLSDGLQDQISGTLSFASASTLHEDLFLFFKNITFQTAFKILLFYALCNYLQSCSRDTQKTHTLFCLEKFCIDEAAYK